jgi:hypothetical protein
MLKRYQILSNCLSELRKSDLRAIDRLQVEVALYSLKIVLLAEEELVRDPCDEREFETIIQFGRSICGPERTTIEVQKFIMYLNEIKEMILIRSGATGSLPADATAR